MTDDYWTLNLGGRDDCTLAYRLESPTTISTFGSDTLELVIIITDPLQAGTTQTLAIVAFYENYPVADYLGESYYQIDVAVDPPCEVHSFQLSTNNVPSEIHYTVADPYPPSYAYSFSLSPACTSIYVTHYTLLVNNVAVDLSPFDMSWLSIEQATPTTTNAVGRVLLSAITSSHFGIYHLQIKAHVSTYPLTTSEDILAFTVIITDGAPCSEAQITGSIPAMQFEIGPSSTPASVSFAAFTYAEYPACGEIDY